LEAEFASWNAGSHNLFSRSLAFNSFDGVAIPVPISQSGSFSVRYFFPADNHTQAQARPPQSKAPVPSSVGVPILHSFTTLNLAVSIAHWVAQSPIFPRVHTSFTFQRTPPGVNIDDATAQVVNPPLYAHSFCTLKASLLHFSNISLVFLANCHTPPLFPHVNIQPYDTVSENGAETTSQATSSIPPTAWYGACDNPAKKSPILEAVELSFTGAGAGVCICGSYHSIS